MTNEQILQKIRKTDWRYLVSRNDTVLLRSITSLGYRYFKKSTGIDWEPHIKFYAGHSILLSGKELDNLSAVFAERGVSGLKNFLAHLYTHVEGLDKIGEDIEKIEPNKLSVKELSIQIHRFIDKALHAHNFLVPVPIAGNVLSNLIWERLPFATPKQKELWLATLTYPRKENYHTKEERSFYDLVRARKDNDSSFPKLLNEHLKEYAWIGARWYWWHLAWQKNDIMRRLEHFADEEKDSMAELQALNKVKEEQEASADALQKELHIRQGSEFSKLIELAKEYVYARTYRTDILYRAGYRARKLFYEIADRISLPHGDIVYLTYEEIEKGIGGGTLPIDHKEVGERKTYAATLMHSRNFFVLSGRKWEKRIKDLGLERVSQTKEIKGNIAYRGIARGVAKVVRGGEELEKVKRGDILVTVMTFPNFIPAMEKAAAFITDEGGILCHAAIVSREMKKPCIIATRIATQVIKDGDKIEVDAEKGVVKILNG